MKPADSSPQKSHHQGEGSWERKASHARECHLLTVHRGERSSSSIMTNTNSSPPSGGAVGVCFVTGHFLAE